MDSLAIPCEICEWTVRTILGEEWIAANPMASPNPMASRLASMVMDLTQSQDYTKMVVGAFVHPTLFSWEELNLQLEKYDLFTREVWWGSLLNRDLFVFYSVPRFVFLSFIYGLGYASPHTFLHWVQWLAFQIGEPLASIVMAKFRVVWQICDHALVDPHRYHSSFPTPMEAASSQESGIVT
ncbi:hypothetical protein SUGI_0752730 [Cryptomeria japonica]|nr:hypothetical protein SUGI_0752730 [Cryptomeria japonica]